MVVLVVTIIIIIILLMRTNVESYDFRKKKSVVSLSIAGVALESRLNTPWTVHLPNEVSPTRTARR